MAAEKRRATSTEFTPAAWSRKAASYSAHASGSKRQRAALRRGHFSTLRPPPGKLRPQQAPFRQGKPRPAPPHSTNRWAMGIRRPLPNARLVTFRPGTACARLYSLRSTRRWIQRTVGASKPLAMISTALRLSST